MANFFEQFGSPAAQPAAAPAQKNFFAQFGGSPAQQDPSFLDKMGQSYDNRVSAAHEASDAYQEGKQSLPETFAQVTLNGVGGMVNDTVGNALGSAVKTVVPQPVREAVSAVADKALNNPIVDAGAKQIQPAYDAAMQYAQDNPRLARNVDAAGNALNLGLNAVAAGDIAKVAAAGEAATPGVTTAMRAAETPAGQLVQAGVTAAKDALTPSEIPTADAIRGEASKAFDFADKAGGVLPAQSRDAWLNTVNQIKPESAEVPRDPAYQNVLDTLNARRGQPLNLQGAQDIYQYLGDEINKNVYPNGKLSDVGKNLQDIQNSLRGAVFNPDPSAFQGGNQGFQAWQEGNRLWQKQAQMMDVENILRRADGKDNPSSVIKNGFSSLYNNAKKLRGYDPEVVGLIKDAADSGIVSDALRTFGSRLIPIVGGAVHGPLGAVLGEATSLASRRGATAVQVGKANRVAQAIGKDYKFVEPEAVGAAPQAPLALPSPTSARPMTDDQIKAAQQVLNTPGRAAPPSNIPHDYGDVPYNYIATEPPAQPQSPLALPAPAAQYISDAAGNVRAMTPEEKAQADAIRQDAISKGMTPDIYANNQRLTLQQLAQMPAAQAMEYLNKMKGK